MKLSKSEREILRLLTPPHTPGRQADSHEMSGLSMVKESRGVLGRGTIYVHLARLQDLGLVQVRIDDLIVAPHNGPSIFMTHSKPWYLPDRKTFEARFGYYRLTELGAALASSVTE